MELISTTKATTTKATKKAKKMSINWTKVYRTVVRLIIAIAVIVASAAVWFCIGEAFPALRSQMPHFFTFVDGILSGFDNLYNFLPVK